MNQSVSMKEMNKQYVIMKEQYEKNDLRVYRLQKLK